MDGDAASNTHIILRGGEGGVNKRAVRETEGRGERERKRERERENK